jgi:hypothetical protein
MSSQKIKAGDGEAIFYSQKNFGGDHRVVRINEGFSWGPIKDHYLSLDVGQAVKASFADMIYSDSSLVELVGQTADLSSVLGDQNMMFVLPNDARAIVFNFKDETGGASKQYSLKLIAAGVGETTLYSNENEAFKLVGTIPEGGPPVVAALYVQDQNTGVYIATGSIFFQWNGGTRQVDVVSSENFPRQLKQERAGASRFVITLISNQPT